MIRPSGPVFVALVCLAASSALAQAPLSLPAAVGRARANNPDGGMAAATEREAEQRSIGTRAGYLPKVDFVESWQRGNQPVFVFGSLLAQRRFTAADFALDALNHPDAQDNLRASLTVEQALFDRGTRANVRSARIGLEMAGTGRAAVDRDLALHVTEAYGRVLTAAAVKQAAGAAVEAARADLKRAADRRDAGIVTDADVLQLDVHLARTLEQQIRADSDEQIARAQLNQAMGEPLDAAFTLEAHPEAAIGPASTDLPALEAEALTYRPDVKVAALQEQLARQATAMARAAFLPQVSAQAGWERNGDNWSSGSSSWVVGAVARINVFHGFADQTRLAEARQEETRRALERQKAETAVRLDVRVALARLSAARASEAVGRAAADQAHEGQRIVRDRYESGLADVASLLRAAEAVQQAETARMSIEVEVLVAAAGLQRALGRP